MIDRVKALLQETHILFHHNQGVLICQIESPHQAIITSKNILYRVVDRQTALYLSGGRTPEVLYSQIAQEEVLQPGTVGMIDERFGKPFHKESNELMIRETGLLRYLQMRGMQFHSMLHSIVTGRNDNDGAVLSKVPHAYVSYTGKKQTRESLADSYDQLLRSLNTIYPKQIGILGIGVDGHTAGIAPSRTNFQNPLFEPAEKSLLVSSFNDKTGYFAQRITQTFLGLSMLDLLIVLVLGKEKETALHAMFEADDEETVPARFYIRPEIAKKTVLITSQDL